MPETDAERKREIAREQARALFREVFGVRRHHLARRADGPFCLVPVPTSQAAAWVPCPKCLAVVGRPCTRPNGRIADHTHRARIKAHRAVLARASSI